MITSLDVVIAKTAGHTADRTGWHSDADNHWNTCECGEKINQSGHSFTGNRQRKLRLRKKVLSMSSVRFVIMLKLQSKSRR